MYCVTKIKQNPTTAQLIVLYTVHSYNSNSPLSVKFIVLHTQLKQRKPTFRPIYCVTNTITIEKPTLLYLLCYIHNYNRASLLSAQCIVLQMQFPVTDAFYIHQLGLAPLPVIIFYTSTLYLYYLHYTIVNIANKDCKQKYY